MINQAADIFSVVISIVTSPTFILYLRVIFTSIGVVLFLGIIYFLLKNNWLKYRFTENIVESVSYRPFGVKKTFKQWNKLIKKLQKGKEADYKMAVIEADGILGDILKRMGYQGDTMKELLGQVDSKIVPNIERVREAHKMRNTIVHDPGYRIDLEETKKILDIYEQAFRDLQMF